MTQRSVALLVGCAVLTACGQLFTIRLDSEPELGATLGTWQGSSWDMEIEPGVEFKGYDVKVGEVPFRVAVNDRYQIVFIQTFDCCFNSPEGLSVGATGAEALRASNSSGLVTDIPNVAYVPLPSGWNAGIAEPDSWDPPATPQAPGRVSMFFKYSPPGSSSGSS